MSKAIIDSSALIFLSYLDLTLKLSVFFDAVVVPGLVEDEVCRKHRFRHRLKNLYRSEFFKKCKVVNEVNRELLLHEGIGLGEADAIAQAQELEIPVFIGDDKAARDSAKRKGKVVVGTAGILSKLYIQGVIKRHPSDLIRKLRRSTLKCRISDEIVEEAMNSAYEPIL